MSDRDAFDTRLGAALRQYAARAPIDVEPHAFARGIAAMAGRGQRPAGVGVLRSVPALAWVLFAAALLVAALAGALVGGRILQNDNLTVVPEPTATGPVAREPACPAGTNPDQPGPVNQARPSPYFATAMAFDRRAGRLVVVTGSYGLVETWVFDVCTNTWTRMDPNREPPSFGRLVYDVDSGATIAVDGSTGHLWAYDLQANTWTEKAVVPADVTLGAYDPVSGLVVAASRYDPTELWNYDVETDTRLPQLDLTRVSMGADPGCGPGDAQAEAVTAGVGSSA
jgi:hypothetical protein